MFGYQTNQQRIDQLRMDFKRLQKEYTLLHEYIFELEKALQLSGILETIDDNGVVSVTRLDPWSGEYKKHYKVNKVSK